jgi:hypothetical protein
MLNPGDLILLKYKYDTMSDIAILSKVLVLSADRCRYDHFGRIHYQLCKVRILWIHHKSYFHRGDVTKTGSASCVRNYQIFLKDLEQVSSSLFYLS